MEDILSGGDLLKGQNHTKLFSQAPAPIAIYKGRELQYVFANDAYLKIFNYRSILGKTVREAFPELEGQPFFGILENVFDTGEPFYGNAIPAVIDVANDGKLCTRYYNLIYTPYQNDEGTIEGVMAFGYDVTEGVIARQKERESDLRFRNIVQQSADPILILKGKDMVLEVANEALCRLWNIGPESFGKGFLEILPEMKGQGFYELLLDVYQQGKTHYGYETPAHFKRANGETDIRYFSFIYQPYHEADGNISGVLVLATDVTEQVITRQSLEQSEHNFENLILQAPVAICVFKGEDYIVEISNERMFQLWGKKGEEVLGKPIFDALPEARGQGLEKLLYNVYHTGNNFVASELPVQLKRNGKLETLYINFVYEPFRSGNGVITGVIGVATDVTEQVVARHQVEYAEESARLAIESAELGTYEINMLTDEMHTSTRFDAIWGLDHKTADRAVFAAAIHPDDQQLRAAAHREALQTGSLQYEARIIWKDGQWRWVRVKGTILYNKQGVAQRLLGVIQDISEQKIFAEELANKVQERTRELTDSAKRLQQSNEELEQFAYIASHDLQEPLRKIQLFNSLVLEQADLNEASKVYMAKATASASRMAGLIRDLLNYSSLSHKNMRFEETDLNVILNNVLIDFELLIKQKEAIIEAGPLPVLQAFPLQMNQLLFNLIGNALKFTKRNTIPRITITSTNITDAAKEHFELPLNKTFAEIIIADNGIGFNEEYAQKIFTIFQRLNEKSLYGGYGIGLALCRKIVDNHSGIIYATGKPKEGASFHFILPYTQT